MDPAQDINAAAPNPPVELPVAIELETEISVGGPVFSLPGPEEGAVSPGQN